MREIRQTPPKNGTRLKKPGKHNAIDRPALIQKGRGDGVLYNERFSKKTAEFQCWSAEFEKKQGIKNS